MDSIDLLTATVKDLQEALCGGLITSAQLTQAYLDNIQANNHRGLKLNAIIETSPLAIEIAHSLDKERSVSGPRSGLHGIPLIVKDNIATDVVLGMNTTAGGSALLGMQVPEDAVVVKKLREAGAVILGKANLSQYSNWFAIPGNGGWSARGGQTLNAYIEGNYEGGSRPSGSSAGSAVGVASGMAAASLATDITGSLTHPAGRSLLYGFKPSVGLVSGIGVIPISVALDCIGPMAKSAYDCALILEVIGEKKGEILYQKYTQFVEAPYATFVGKTLGVPRGSLINPDNTTETATFDKALEKMASLGATIVDPADFPSLEQDKAKIPPKNHDFITTTDMKVDIEEYMATLTGEGPRTLEDLIRYNNEHQGLFRTLIFVPGMPGNQKRFIDSLNTKGKMDPEYIQATEENYQLCAVEGIDAVIDKYHLDALVLPDHIWYPGYVGYPVGVVPLGLVEGKPTGMCFAGKMWSEDKLLSLMAAYEANFPARVVPERLRGIKGE